MARSSRLSDRDHPLYVASIANGRPERHVGHNPPGALAIPALLGLCLATAASGYAVYEELGGEWLEETHEALAFTTLAVVGVHVVGVLASSFLHRNATDRLWVTWRLACHGAASRHEGPNAGGLPTNVPALVEIGENDVPILNDLEKSLSENGIAIEIPADINALELESPGLAAEWRKATRIAFSEAIGRGFRVEDFYRTGLTDCRIGTYVLVRRDEG